MDELVLKQSINQNEDICLREHLVLKTIVCNFSNSTFYNLRLIISAKPYYDVKSEIDSNIVLDKRRLHTAIYHIDRLAPNTTSVVKQTLSTLGFNHISTQALLCDSKFKIIHRVKSN